MVEVTLSTVVPQRCGYRLPTDEEWEYAAQADKIDLLYAGSSQLAQVGWFKGNAQGKTHPVAVLNANAWGLYDMSGNVGEWVWEPTKGYKLARGGAWHREESKAQIKSLTGYAAADRNPYTGFRIATSAPTRVSP